jgi:tRNA/tmRNA/rRNA uracil-C5-methylase (TrmA/RlmC/RlmD family)
MQEMMDGNGDDRDGQAPDPRGKVTYTVASAASALHKGEALGADVLIVDPPRKGLEEEVLVQLCKPHNPKQGYTEDPMFLQGPKYSTNWVNDVETLVYVSCGFDALARDCDRLLKGNAGWKLESATGYVLFPGSNHVETVAVFKRRAGREDYNY